MPASACPRPLAIVVVSGVATSTLLTLMVLPVLYLRFGAGDREPADVLVEGAHDEEADA